MHTLLRIEEGRLEEAIYDIINTDKEYLEELKNKPVEPYQMHLLIDKFDLVGCSKYRASTLIAFLANEELINKKVEA